MVKCGEDGLDFDMVIMCEVLMPSKCGHCNYSSLSLQPQKALLSLFLKASAASLLCDLLSVDHLLRRDSDVRFHSSCRGIFTVCDCAASGY